MCSKLNIFARVLLVSFLFTQAQFAQEPVEKLYYVSLDGNDSWTGTLPVPDTNKTDGPFATITQARDAIRELKKTGKFTEPVTVMLRGGIYILSKPLEFKPEDSGLKNAPITYKPFPGEKVSVFGGIPIKGQWQQFRENIYKISLPGVAKGEWNFNQLFVNGCRQTRARTPNEDYFNAYDIPPESNNSFIFATGDIDKNWRNLDDVQVVVFHSWSESRLYIKDVNEENRLVTFSGSSAYALDKWTKYPRYYVENVFEGLDSPGEWYLDRAKGVLYYWPPDSIDLKQAEIIAPKIKQLVALKGNIKEKNPIQYLTFSHLSFANSGYEFPPEGYINGGGATGPMYRPSAILLQHASNITIQNCLIENVATYAIELADASSNCRFENNIIRYAGGGGIIILDGTDNVVTNNHIHHCGRIFFGGTGIVNPEGVRTRIAHNLIHDMPYCGIRGGNWGIELNEVIEYNHVYHVMNMLDDGACIFNCGIGSVIRNNLVHDSYGFSKMAWGLYLDEFRTGVRMENNISYNTRSGGLHLHNNYGHTIVNNIFAFSRTGQISWTRFHGIHFNVRKAKYRHPLHTFQRNIVYWTEGVFSYNMDCNRWDLATQPDLIDYNLYYKASGDHKVTMGLGHGGKPGYDSFEDWQEFGLDKHSIEADPLFVDPENGDFTLQPGSSAYQLGFKPIDISNAGLLHHKIGPQNE